MREVEQKIIEYIKENWSTTPIDWGWQRQETTANSWIAIHFLSDIREASRKEDKFLNLLLSIGVFSTDENLYSISDIMDGLRDLLEQKCLNSANFNIEFREFSVAMLPNETLSKNRMIKHANVDIPILAQLKR